MFIFPGVGIAAVLCGAKRVTDRMFYRAAEALASTLSADDLQHGRVFPDVARIREVTIKVASSVILSALEDGLATRGPFLDAEFRHKLPTEEMVEAHVRLNQFSPVYAPLVERPAEAGYDLV